MEFHDGGNRRAADHRSAIFYVPNFRIVVLLQRIGDVNRGGKKNKGIYLIEACSNLYRSPTLVVFFFFFKPRILRSRVTDYHIS